MSVGGVLVEIVREFVAGIDVHKKQVTVAVRTPGQGRGERRMQVKMFRTFWKQLTKMADWLVGPGGQ